MIDKKWIGYELAPSTMTMERGQVRFFAQSIGETHAMYFDEAAAKDAGYAHIVVPPTFLFAVEMESGVTARMLADMGVPWTKLLHADQGFTYHRPVCVGDTVTVRSRIEDVYDKKNGALEFVVKTSRATNQHGDLVAEMRTVFVCKNA